MPSISNAQYQELVQFKEYALSLEKANEARGFANRFGNVLLAKLAETPFAEWPTQVQEVFSSMEESDSKQAYVELLPKVATPDPVDTATSA